MLKKILFSFSFICLFSLYAAAQSSTMDYASSKEYTIKDISISGIKFLDPMVLISVSGLAVGDTITIPGDEVTSAIKKLWAQGLFSDVKITASKIEGSDIYLDYYLQERPRISAISITGVKKGDVEDLRDMLNLRVGAQITETLLDNSVFLIKKHYRGKGFLNAEIEVSQENDTVVSNGVRLTFAIDKNDRVKISDIVFDGNKAIAARKLRKAMKKTHRRDWNIFKSSKFIENDYDEDKNNLIAYYNEHGYRDARILKDSVFTVSNNRVGIKLWLEEGSKYYIRSIKWVGNTKLPSEALDQVLGMSEGDVYDQSLLEKRLFIDENSVSTVYMDDGYLFFNLQPVEVRVDKDSVDLEMRIFEGEQATINKVTIAGNTKTNEHVIRREIWSKPGALFSKSEITRTIRELAQLGHFDPEKLDVKPLPNPADGTVDLHYAVEEKANDQLEISGGWGADMFVGTIGIRFSNFSVRRLFERKAWRPVPSGDSQTLSLRAQTNGKYYKAFSFTFAEPWLGGKKPTNFSFSVYHTIRNNSTSIFRSGDQSMKVTGASVALGTRLPWPDDYFTLNTELSFQNYLLDNYVGYFSFSDGQSNNFSLRTTFARNSVDQLIYPRRGSNFSISLQLTPPYSLFNGKDYTDPAMKDSERYKWIEYHKWTGKAQWYLALAGDLVLNVNAQFGYLGYYSRKVGYSPFEGFIVGGDGMSGYTQYGSENIGLRGYTNGSLTKSLISSSDNVYDKFTMELRYPISLKPQAAIYLLAFLEGGNSWYEFNEVNPFNMHRSAGFGARMFLPMLGMLGVDWGYGFDKIPGNPSANGSQFHFVIGMPF